MIGFEPVNPRYIGNNNESILYFSFYLPLGLLLNYILNQISSYNCKFFFAPLIKGGWGDLNLETQAQNENHPSIRRMISNFLHFSSNSKNF